MVKYNCKNLCDIILLEMVEKHQVLSGFTDYQKNAEELDSNYYKQCRLKDIEMGSGIAQIGEFAFEKCNAIKSFTYNGKVEDWNLVKLDRLWEGYVHHCAIKCKDGVIATNGTVTYN